MQVKQVTGVAEQFFDVAGLVCELVTGIIFPIDHIAGAAAVAVNEPFQQEDGIGVDYLLLPGLEEYRAQMLWSSTMLWEKGGPVLAVAGNLQTVTLFIDCVNFVLG